MAHTFCGADSRMRRIYSQSTSLSPHIRFTAFPQYSLFKMRDPYGPYGSYPSNHRNDRRYEMDTQWPSPPSEHKAVLRPCLYLLAITLIFVFYFLGYHQQLMFRDKDFFHAEMVMDRYYGSRPINKKGKIGRWARNHLAFPVVETLLPELTITFQHVIIKGAVSKVKNGKFTFNELYEMADRTDPENVSIIQGLRLGARLHGELVIGSFICIILLGIAWICNVLRFMSSKTVRNVAKTVSVLCLIGVLAIKLYTAIDVLIADLPGAAKLVTTMGALYYLDIMVVFLCFVLLTMTAVSRCMHMCCPQAIERRNDCYESVQNLCCPKRIIIRRDPRTRWDDNRQMRRRRNPQIWNPRLEPISEFPMFEGDYI